MISVYVVVIVGLIDMVNWFVRSSASLNPMFPMFQAVISIPKGCEQGCERSGNCNMCLVLSGESPHSNVVSLCTSSIFSCFYGMLFLFVADCGTSTAN